MPAEGMLIGMAQLGVAIAGFAGVVAVFRHDETWTEIQAFRLRVLVRNSLGVMFMALLPLVYFAAFGDVHQAIGAASGSSAVWMALTIAQLQRHMIRAGGFKGAWRSGSLVSVLVAMGLFAANAIWLDATWPYLAGLALVLLAAALAFQRMIGVRGA